LSTAVDTGDSADIRAQIRAAVHHLEHVLPGQAPIKDFVHHNTLHGFEHLPFPQALKEARQLTGTYGYLPAERFRTLFRQGRITREDLIRVLDGEEGLGSGEVLFETRDGPVTRRDISLLALIHAPKPLRPSQLGWLIDEQKVLERIGAEVSAQSRARLLAAAGSPEGAAVADLWNACLGVLGLEHYRLHPEELIDLSPEQAERMLDRLVPREERESGKPLAQARMQRYAGERLVGLLEGVGVEITLRGLLLALTGEDLLEPLRPYLIRQLASHLDLGTAAWSHRDRAEGFYGAWRQSAQRDVGWVLEALSDGSEELDGLPADPLEAILVLLGRLDLPKTRWVGYLERLALELSGWSGMFLWRQLHPGYAGQGYPVGLLDYLAVRLVLERLFARRLCAELWQIEPSLGLLRWYFRHNPSELLVRQELFSGRLPEYLAGRAQRLVNRRDGGDPEERAAQWEHLAHLVWTYKRSPAADELGGYSVYRHAWPLFRLAQHLGLCGAEIRALSDAEIKALLACLGGLDEEAAGLIWLRAYENHYRDQIFSALTQHHGRGRWAGRAERPQAQLVFCMDEREEGFRRHLETHNPAIETLGAAGFFGVAINWRGLDDEGVTPLCPVVVRPTHEVPEFARPHQEPLAETHRRRRGLRLRLQNFLHQEIRRNLLTSTAAIAVSGLPGLATLAAKVLLPGPTGRLAERLRQGFDLRVPTALGLTAADDGSLATPEHNRLGFTDAEQADRVEGFLRTIGLTTGFAPLVVLVGHGSSSQNNPHRSAYDCGACSGRHGGPNARVFAAMANRPEVRATLVARGLQIPQDCWFLGAFHNTCDEQIDWFDEADLPESHRPVLAELKRDLEIATRHSAHERCRKFVSAPRNPSLEQALAHIRGRSQDPSQARPELGHATNACALIGRRAVTQGLFLDRRMFLISYDSREDPEGRVLEAILLAAGPVGAGINLEYYFSTVNNDQYGCGSKVTHNVTGFLGVMEGASSDLRTGLPLQMIEIHEPMRLQVIVEATTEVLSAIYERQPPLRELIGNGWVLLSAKDPTSPAIHVFDPARGWRRWEGAALPLARVGSWADHYRGTLEPLLPAMLAEGSRRA